MSATEVPIAAEHLLSHEPALMRTFPAAKVDSVDAYGSLHIVNLSPSGHLLVKGELSAPKLLGYGETAWSLPEEGTPARTVLDALERYEPVATAAAGARLLAAEEATVEQAIPAMVSVNWNQQHPWNLYLPVLGNNNQDGAYVGCVGTMFAQLLTAHRWPARVEDELSHAMGMDYTSPITGTSREWLRFDAQEPLPWADMFSSTLTAYKEKHAVSRLSFWADMVATMHYLQTGSTSTIGYCMNANQLPYYESPGVTQVSNMTIDEIRPLVYDSLANGCPVGVEIMYDSTMAHAIILDGWQPSADGSLPLVHANYGWSGNYTAWYALNALPAQLRALACNFKPQPRAQVVPLPAATAAAPTLTWDFPAYWETRGLSGWTLDTASTVGQSVTTLADDFSALVDAHVATDSQNEQKAIFSVGTLPNSVDSVNGSATDRYLMVSSIQDYHPKTYTWPTLFVPQADSTLSFNLQVCEAKNLRLAVQIKVGNAPWQDIHVAEKVLSSTGTEKAYSISLAAYAGLPCQLRLRAQHDYYDPSEGTAIFDNVQAWRFRKWQVNQVTPLATHSTTTLADPAVRTFTPTSLTEGAAYAWQVTPRFSTTTLGKSSAAVATTLRSDAPAPVTFESITDSKGTALDEGIRRASAPAGRTVLRVKLSDGATLLKPICQNQSLLTDEDFTIYDQGNGTFDVTFTMSGKSTKAISAYTTNAVLLTLRAANGEGNVAAKDVLIQFLDTAASEANPATGEVDPGDTPGESGIYEPSLGGDETARQATEVTTASGTLLRFAPGLTYNETDGTWSGWVDNGGNASFAWAFPPANVLTWWLDNFRKQGGTLTPGSAEAKYIGESATSAGGYASPVADAFIDNWSAGTYGYQPLYALQWLFDGTYLSMGDNWAAPTTATLPKGLVRNAVATSRIPDLQVYVGKSTSSYTNLGDDTEGQKRSFAKYLLDTLEHGPIMVATYTSYLTIWGVEAKEVVENGEPVWQVLKVYVTDPNTDAGLEALDYKGVSKVLGSYYPILGEETRVERTIPIYAYGHAKGQASSGEGGSGSGSEGGSGSDPTPDPTPGDSADPTPDPEIPDENLGNHYPYEIHRSYWIARWEAIRQGKLIFVLSGADWCSWCSRVKDYLGTVSGFADDFVVYFASRDSYSYSPYFSGGLPQYGTADPRQANPFAGVAPSSDGSMAWSNVWTAAGSGLIYSRRGYDEPSILAAISAAREAYPNGIQSGSIEAPTLAIKGPTHVLANSPTAYALTVTFPDNVKMTLDHRVKWEVLAGSGTITEAGVLTATATGTLTLKATNFHDFPGTAAEVTVTVVEASDIKALTIPDEALDLALTPTPQVTCQATFSDGTQAAILPSSWSVAYVTNSLKPLVNFGTGYEPAPTIASDGTLSYTNTSVANHKVSVTASMTGGPSVTREITIYGPRQMIPSKVSLLSNSRVSAGSVIRLKVNELSYNDKLETKTTTETALANYYLTVTDSGTSIVASSRTPDWTIALGPSFSTTPSGTALSAKVAASAQNSAYTSYEAWPNLTQSLTYIPAGKVVEQGKYGNVPSGWLEAYFPDTEHTAAQAQADSDGDGYANWEEFILGTEPNKADDAFAYTSQHFSAMVSDATINLYYKVMYTLRSGREYTLQAKVNWGDEWTTVGVIDADKRTQPEVINQTLADTANFFRVTVRFSKESGSYNYTNDSVTPAGMAIAPNAVLDFSDGNYPAWNALAMDDYAPGNPKIRLPADVAHGTVVLSAPASCERWMKCFRPEDTQAYGFEVKTNASTGRLELIVAAPTANPQPEPPHGDPDDFLDEVKSHLSNVAREAGFTENFSLRMRDRQGAFNEPDVAHVNDVMRCFTNLAIEPNADDKTLTIHYDFGIDSMNFIDYEGKPCVIFGAKVSSQLPNARSSSQADFAAGASLGLFVRQTVTAEGAEVGSTEVTDATGLTAGRCSTPGQRYFRFPLSNLGETGAGAQFFTIRVSR